MVSLLTPNFIKSVLLNNINMKKQKYNELKRNSKIPKGDKIKKELREKR